MTSQTDETPSGITARRIRQVRRRRDITVAQLAVRCHELGRPDLTADVISNIESGRPSAAWRRRRDVTVDELLVLAAALGVAPINLLVPPDAGETPYPVTPERPEPARTVRDWVRGFVLLPGHDWQVSLIEAPQEDYWVEDDVPFSVWVRQPVPQWAQGEEPDNG
jgi:transcriptional regulator with XRE-family HTH domain